ncbi:hypothetical protein DRO42_02905 [Candidatus Bathyarchaeota archaeon]|nr:MAG: hypothetical protein DRO42_02905 [Candidatus Bathyarchaeota archaeon]
MRGQPIQVPPSALLQEEKEGVEVDRLSALEIRVARLEASYKRFLKRFDEALEAYLRAKEVEA